MKWKKFKIVCLDCGGDAEIITFGEYSEGSCDAVDVKYIEIECKVCKEIEEIEERS